MNEPSSLENKRLNAILAEYLKRKDAGQPLNEEALLKAYPDLADGLRSYFQGEVVIGNAAPKPAEETGQPKSNRESVFGNIRETLKPGTRQPETASDLLNRSFGRYTILRQLGEGAMGNVYLAHDTALDRQIALKVPKTPFGGNEDFMARFTREAKAAAGLKYPNICSVYDADEYNGIPYITMDFIDGVPLSRFIGSKKMQSVDSVLQMISTIAEAVDHAHSNGVIHRDLKPGNILVDATFRPHITDFGLARRVGQFDEAKATHEGLLLGTPAYMAPEQVKGEQAKVGPQSDIYSLGVMLFELLTSRLPFEGSVPEILAQVLRDSPPVPSRIRKDLTEDVDDLCLKMLRKEPNERYLSMAEVVTAIQRLRQKTEKAHGLPVESKTPQSPFDIRQAHIEALLKKGQYAAAIQDLEKLVRDKTPAARKCVEWAQKQLPRVRAEEKSLNPEGIEAFLRTATQLYEKYDYAGCIQLLTDIPSLRRSENMEDLLRNATKKELEAEQLLSDIKDAERRKVLDGIEPLVNRLLKLKPGNTYAQRLWDAMQSYRSTSASRRKYRFENGRLQPSAETGFLRHWYVIAILVGVLAFLPGYFYSTSYFSSEQQALTLHVDDDWLRTQGGEITLVIDGNRHTITDHMLHDDFSVTVTPGSHNVSVLSGDSVLHDSQTIEVQKDGGHLLQISAEDLSLVASIPRQTIDPMDVPALAADPSVESATSPAEAVNAAADVAPELQPEAPSLPEEITNSIGMKLRLIPAGEFTMGSPTSEPGRNPAETQHHVTLTVPFLLGVQEVTQSQYETVMGSNPSEFKGAKKPVETVSWDDAVAFCAKLSALSAELAAGREYRLPTEAEWEYACRAGTTTAYSFGDDERDLTEYAWFGDNSSNTSHAVGEKLPNGWGLYDMHGNVWEWCSDEASGGSLRVLSGGGWNGAAPLCRAAFRPADYPTNRYSSRGFRVALSSPSVSLAKSEEMSPPQAEQAPPHISSQPEEITNSIGTKLKVIPAGEFLMGSPEDEAERDDDEKQHRVEITKPYYIGVTEITQSASNSVDEGRGTAAPPAAVAPFDAAQAKVHQETWADHLGMAVESTNSIGMAFVVIPAGEFTMGSPRFEAGREQGETEHRVTLTQPFEMGIYEVTQKQYEQVVGHNPSRFKGANHPVDTVNWFDAVEFCRLLSALPAEQAAGRKYRLPTEAEWEYVCRAGTATTYSFGDDERQLVKYAWYDNQSGGYSTHPVGQRQGNAWGIFDMHGNVWEWCFDWHAPYTAEAVSDPQGPHSGTRRAIRGGAFFFKATDVRCANRDTGEQETRDRNASGFRVVMTLSVLLSKAVTDKESSVPPAQISSQPDPSKSTIDVETSGKGLNEAAIDQFTGRWRIINPTGQTSFYMTLTRSFSAQKTDRPIASGVWEVVGDEVRITWSDGWRDILRPENGGITKIAFKPKTSWDAKPDNIERAVKMTEPDDGKSK